jgi:hypothetical protein
VVGDPLPVERGPQEADGVPHPRIRPFERGAVPLLHHVLAGRPDADVDRLAAQLGHGERVHGHQGRTALEDTGDRGSQPQPRHLLGRHEQRRERVHGVGLARPEVGVTGGRQLAEEGRELGHRLVRDRNRHAEPVHLVTAYLSCPGSRA